MPGINKPARRYITLMLKQREPTQAQPLPGLLTSLQLQGGYETRNVLTLWAQDLLPFLDIS